MARSNARTGMGTLLQAASTDGGNDFTTVAEVTKTGGPTMKALTTDVTHFLSPGNVKEFIGTLLEGGDVKFDVNYLGSDHATLVSLLGVTVTWRIVWPFSPTAYTCTFSAILDAFDVNAEPAKQMTATCGLKVAGLPVFAALS